MQIMVYNRDKGIIIVKFSLTFMNDEERNTYSILLGVILLILVPTIILGFLGLGFLEYLAAIFIILIIGLLFFGYDSFLK